MALTPQPTCTGDRYHSGLTFKDKGVEQTLIDAWFDDNVKDVTPEARQLLEGYSHVAPRDVVPHVLALRARAFSIANYACIGQMRFLLYNLKLLPFYTTVVDKLKAGGTFMDAGSCVGQELRYLIANEGIPSERLYAFDMSPTLMDIGFELFLDRDTFRGTMVVGDVLLEEGNPEGAALAALNGQMDVVFASSFMHIWPWDEMIRVAKRLARLARPVPGSMICGKQLGSNKPGHYEMPNAYGRNYRHNGESMRRFWEQIGRETDTEWHVEADTYPGDLELGQNRQHWWAESDEAMLWFCITRVK